TERHGDAGHRALLDFVLEGTPGLARLLARLVGSRAQPLAAFIGGGVGQLPDSLADAGELFLQLLEFVPEFLKFLFGTGSHGSSCFDSDFRSFQLKTTTQTENACVLIRSSGK